MKAVERLMLSRRLLLQGATVASGYILTTAPREIAISATRGAVRTDLVDPERLDSATTKFFGATWNQEYLASFPTRYTCGPKDFRSTLQVEWDERLFTLHDPAFGTFGGSTMELTIRRPSAHAALIDIPAGIADVVLRVEPLNAYPAENLTDVTPVSLALWGHEGDRIEAWVDAMAPIDCAAWSLEAAANWVCIDGQIVPARAWVESVGPFEAPAGAVLRLRHADMLGAEPTLTDTATGGLDSKTAGAKLDTIVVDGIRAFTLTTSRPLPPGARLELMFDVDASNSEPLAFGGHVPRLQLLPPVPQTGMRLSGKHSSFPVTRSGSQFSTYLSPTNA